MSKARLVITAVVSQHRPVSEVAASYGVSRQWIYKLLARYRLEGEAAFEARSRRPLFSPTATLETIAAAVVAERDRLAGLGWDAGAESIAWHLHQRHGPDLPVPSRATIHRILRRAGRVVPEPRKKPKSAYIRFAAEQPNQTWQSDFTHYRLTNPDGSAGADVEVITWLDDHSRYALHVSAHAKITTTIVLATFTAACDEHGQPASTLTDNGMVYTVRHASARVRGGRNAFEHHLHVHGITQKNSRPNHPTTCGKVERFQQTLKKWLRAQPAQPATITELQHLLHLFTHAYNTARPHRSLNRRTPLAAYTARPKATPSGEPTTRTHTRVRTDRVNNGKITLRHNSVLYSIGIGRAHNGRAVTALIDDLDITISDTTTGEILRSLTLDPTRKYQPQHTPHNAKQPEP